MFDFLFGDFRFRRGIKSNRYAARQFSVPASINRNTGKPHEHKREIARRARQAAARGAASHG